MAILRTVLRVYSYLAHLPLVLFLVAVSGMTLLSGQHTLHLDLLPWEGAQLTWWMFGLGLTGLLTLVLAILGKARFLFTLWAAAVPVMLIRGFFLSPRAFNDRDAFLNALYCTLAMLVAAIGAWPPGSKKR